MDHRFSSAPLKYGTNNIRSINSIVLIILLVLSSCSINGSFRWNAVRVKKAENLGLNKSGVIILSSIVEKETNLKSEKGKVARVYLNRLEKNMPLQSDQTLRYAIGDTSGKRLLNSNLNIDSPFNTYKFKGLPPSPICKPSRETILLVLNCKKHPYLYFCPSPELDGGFVYATTYKEHTANVKRYSEALNKMNIK
ncbi:MAG: endolytic transglycosylase MltG [Flavobacteriales bacterium]|nr:endolytic transglycosylase MltG [Flavobacteriales bacterium]